MIWYSKMIALGIFCFHLWGAKTYQIKWIWNCCVIFPLGLIEASCTNAWRDYHPYRWVEWFQALPHRVVHWSNQSHRGMDCSFCYVYSLLVPRIVQILLVFVEQFGVWFDHLTRLELRNSQHETKFSCAGGNTICTISQSRFKRQSGSTHRRRPWACSSSTSLSWRCWCNG